MKKFLLAMLGVLLALPTFARDFEYEYEGQTITYTVIDEDAKTVMTKAGNGNSSGNNISGKLILPSNPKDGSTVYTLTEIGQYSFMNNDLTSLTLPNSLTKIGKNAFNGCQLNEVKIPESVTVIGVNAFGDDCKLDFSSIEQICHTDFKDYDDNMLDSWERTINRQPLPNHLVIPEGVTSIGWGAFESCRNITSVSLPNSLTTIGDNAFGSCKLTSLKLPEGLLSIGKRAFYRSQLTSLTLPEGLLSIGASAFYYSELRSLTLDEGLLSIGDGAFCSTKLTSLIIPSSVESLAHGAINPNAFYPLKVCKIESNKQFFDLNVDADGLLIVPEDMLQRYIQSYYHVKNIISGDINFTFEGENNTFDIGLNDSKTLSLSLQDADVVNGFQTDITLPAGLSIASNSGKLDVTLGSGKAASHVVTAMKVAGPNTYRIVVYSSKNDVFTSGENLLNIGIKSDATLRGGDITVGNTILTLINDFSLSPEDLTITVPSFISAESVSVTPSEATVNLGNTVQLTAEVFPANAWNKTVTWTSSDSSVATVNAEGLVTPVAKGVVTITATTADGSNLSASAQITVTNYAQSLDLGDEHITIEEDETMQLNPVFAPADAEATDLLWSTTDSNVAYVDEQNVLHSVYPGEVTVTATNPASGLSASILVTVTPVLYGDANDDNVVAVNDLTTEVQYILEQNPTPFSFKKADVNRDRVVNIIDVAKTVNIILSEPASSSSMRKAAGARSAGIDGMDHGAVSVDANGRAKFTVSLSNMADITALQGNINLPEGMSISNISFADSQTGDHIVDFIRVDENETRFVVYSLSLDRLAQSTPVMEIEVEGYDETAPQVALIHDVYAADTNSNLQKINDVPVEVSPGIVTGVDAIGSDSYPCDIYTLSGICVKRNATPEDIEALAPGIYIINNEKVYR